MSVKEPSGAFRTLNRGYRHTFRSGALSLGLVVPIERYAVGKRPELSRHVERVQLAEELGFSAVWLRDVPFDVPTFGDTGQIYDPFVYLGLLAGQTDHIALGTASIILPLRHPAHVAKAAASVDVLSGGRLILGVASGDRPEEYPALNLPFDNRGERFRSAFDYIRRMAEDRPVFQSEYGSPGGGMDLLPKPTAGRLPLLITGASQQAPQWLAENGDGWITYPRPLPQQASIVSGWRERIRAAGLADKPAMQSLYLDLVANDAEPATPIHLGYRAGMQAVRAYLRQIQAIGINHVAINLRLNQADTESTMKRLSRELIAELPQGEALP